ncbi:glycosyltransferase family 4 protein [Paenibacillus faecalis]|uniref:glycosyltransferase family 4 protein n=1 Tax=Paenibacillus faecalis TaxID=2079532 RepID=UPI000D101479|nr:glycosyltransferase family 4 protein [Paenibacillus faecalis]
MKIVLVGPYPPPIGGISIHIQRAAGHLRQHGWDCDIYDESSGSNRPEGVYPIHSYTSFIMRFPWLQGDLFHFHSISRSFRIMLGLFKMFGKKIMLTAHGDSLKRQIEQSNPASRFLFIRSLRMIDHIVCVNKADRDMLLSFGFRSNQVTALPSFIKPIETEQHLLQIPREVTDFMEAGEFTITANGCIRLDQGRDLYGADLLVQLLQDLTVKGYKARILFALLGSSEQSAEERRYYNELKERLREWGLESRFYFYEVDQTELYPLLRKSHLFVRPTLTDGFGVSIAEALACGIPALASDVCRRPEGATLFKSGNADDLLEKVQDVMDNYSSRKQEILDLPIPDYMSELLMLYKRVMSKTRLDSNMVIGPDGK